MDVVLAGRNFDEGYKSDTARDQLSPGVAYRMYDFIPQVGQPLRRRGGWTFSTKDLNAVAACTRLSGVAWAPIQNDPHLVCIADNGKVFADNSNNGSGGNYVGNTSFAPITCRPFWARDLNPPYGGLVIMQALGATAATPQKYTGSAGTYALAALGGSPPQACVGSPYGDWILLANGTSGGVRYANRIWASSPAAPETWPANGFFDMPEEVVRLWPLRNLLLVFGYRQIWGLTGDTPPPGGNWSKVDLFTSGTMDGRTVASWRDSVLFANNAGVFMTDGSTLTDLTDVGGISQHWQELVANFNFTAGWSAAAGVFQGNYIIVVHDNAGNFVTCQVCDIDKRVWFEFKNVRAAMFAERQSGPGNPITAADGHEELFFAHRTIPRAGMISGIWEPPVQADGDAAAILPVLETPFYKMNSPGPKQMRQVWITHDLRAPGGGAPTLTVEGALTPGASYFSLGTLKATTKEQRYPIWVRRRGLGVGLRISQVLASTDTALAEIEFESRALSRNRRG